MEQYCLTKVQARRFMLYKHGLLGPHQFAGKSGVLDFVRHIGSIQYDPVDVCGRNDSILLCSRVQGYDLAMLEELLYTDRVLVDYFDKNLCIVPTEDWRYFDRTRKQYSQNRRVLPEVEQAAAMVLEQIEQQGPMCSQDFANQEKVDWYWSKTSCARAALEHLYFCGKLVIHHKKRTIRYYDLAQRHLPADILAGSDPNRTEADYIAWNILRRIGAMGLAWNKASDGWLGIHGLNAQGRKTAFETLLAQGKITPLQVEGMAETLYCTTADLPLLHKSREMGEVTPRLEFIAPLDSLLWDRKLIAELFEFSYKWEIYTPESQRKYGCYVLPVLYGDRFIGRIELACRRKERCLLVKNFWPEEGIKLDKACKKAIKGQLARFGAVQGCPAVVQETAI